MAADQGPRLAIGILCHPTLGGSGVVASELALTLAARGHRVHLFSYAVPPRLARARGAVEVHVAEALPYPLFPEPPRDLAVVSSVLDVSTSRGLDVLHAHYALPHAVSALVAAAAAARVGRTLRTVVTLHGTDVTIVGRDPAYAPLTSLVLRTADAITCVSASLAEATARELLVPRPDATDPRIEVLPNFVDGEAFHPVAESPSEAAARPPRCVHVSNFRPVKRVPFLVEAFARATARGSGVEHAELVLVGDGPERAPAARRAEQLGVAPRVRFLGERDAIPALFAPADCFALPSSEEAFGLAALESMACGVPVVASRVGGLPEVVTDGVTGYLVEPGGGDELGAFAERLRELLVDRQRSVGLGAAARADALARFDRGAIVDRYEALYRRVTA